MPTPWYALHMAETITFPLVLSLFTRKGLVDLNEYPPSWARWRVGATGSGEIVRKPTKDGGSLLFRGNGSAYHLPLFAIPVEEL